MKDSYIIFSVAGTAYALATEHVAHIEMVDEVTRVPNAPPYVDGVVFSRGEVVPALNLRVRFGFDRVPYTTHTRLVVIRPGSRLVGLIVDSAREFLTIPDASIAPPNEALAGINGAYLRGIATLGTRVVVILDLEALLAQADTAVYSEEIR
jgi:purine-binding chemotaxis protein CheW